MNSLFSTLVKAAWLTLLLWASPSLFAQGFSESTEAFAQQISPPPTGKGTPIHRIHLSENGNLPCRLLYQYAQGKEIHRFEFYPANIDSSSLQIGGDIEGAFISLHFQRGYEALHTTVREKDQKTLTSETQPELRFYFPDPHVADRAANTLRNLILAGADCLDQVRR